MRAVGAVDNVSRRSALLSTVVDSFNKDGRGTFFDAEGQFKVHWLKLKASCAVSFKDTHFVTAVVIVDLSVVSRCRAERDLN